MAERDHSADPGRRATTVWWATRRPVEGLDDSILAPDELARIDRLRSSTGRERSTLARIVLRLALAERLDLPPSDVPLDWSAGPRLQSSGAGPWLSLSHSADRVVVAISDAGPVGLDIEAASRALRLRPGTVERACTAGERAALAALPDADRPAAALRLWTAKEAILKATRHGLSVAPDGVEFDSVTQPRSLVRFDPQPGLVGGSWLGALSLDPAYVGSVAVLAPGRGPVIERDGDALLVPAAR